MSVTIYNPPTKWWRRGQQRTITLWPIWLAQKLCNHKCPITIVGSFTNRITGEAIFYGQCSDCEKHIEFDGPHDFGDTVLYEQRKRS